MKKHTIGYKEQIKEMGRESDSIITFGETVLGSEELNAVTPSFQSGLLKSAMKQLDVDSNVEIPVGTILNYKFGTKVNGEYEYIDYGNYVVKEVEKQEDTLSYKITCYDKMLYSMKDYVDFDVEYPISVREYINSLCEYLGLKFANINDKFVNYDKEILNELYLDENGNSLGYTFRDVFDELAQVTASTICINNNDEVEIRYIKDAINSSVKKGTKIETNDSMDYPVLNYKQYGYTKQNVYSGKNFLNVPSEYSVTGMKEVNMNIPIGSYVINWDDIITDGTSTSMLIYFHYEDGTTLAKYISPTYTSKSLSFTTTKNVNKVGIYSQGNYNNSQGITTTFKKLMISTNGGEYEPYVGGKASPSPNYPQEIEVGRGKNSFDGEFELGTIDINTGIDVSENTRIRTKNYQSILPNTEYTISGEASATRWGIFYDKNKNYLGYKQISSITTKGTITTIDNAYYLRWYLVNYTNLENKEQLEKGSVATSYLPYNTIESKSNSTNMFNAKLITANGILVNEDGSKITMPIVSSGNGLTYTNIALKRLAPNLKVGDVVTLYATNNSANVYNTYIYLTAPASMLWSFGHTKTITEDMLNSAVALYGNRFIDGETQQITISDFRMVLGETDKPFEPYQESFIQHHLGDNFLADKDYIENGVLNKNIGKVVLNGSENWLENSASKGLFQITLSNVYYNNTTINALSDKLIGTTGTIITTSNYYINNSVATYSNNRLFFRFDEFAENLDGLKAWLKENPVTVYYELATPEQIQLETTGELRTFEPNTIITNDLDSDMEVEYGNSFDTIDEEYFKDINVNFGEKYGPINSVVLSRASESDNIYLRDEESVEKNGLCELKIKENQIMNFNNRDEFLQGIFEKLNGTEYHLNDFASTGITYYDICDRYKVMIGDKTYSCVMFNDEILVTQGLEENVFTEMPEESETDYTKADKTDRKINQTYILADKQNQRIEALTSTVSTLNTTTNNNYQEILGKFEDYTPTSQTIQLEQSVTQLQTDTYTKTEINTKLTDGSVTKVRTTSGTFDEDGMHYEKTGAPTKSTINEAGVSVDSSSSGEELLFAGYDKDINQTIVRTENLTIRRYLVVGENTRIENYTDEDGNVGGGLFIL